LNKVHKSCLGKCLTHVWLIARKDVRDDNVSPQVSDHAPKTSLGYLENMRALLRLNTTVFADGNCAWRSEAERLGLRCEPVCHQQKVFVRNIHDGMDAGTQVLDRTWLELRRFLVDKFPVSLKVAGHRRVEPFLADLVFQFVYRQSVMPATPNEFYSALKRLLKAT
jgi:hypothetical protein